MPSTNNPPFKHLADLVGGYFHQDLDLDRVGLEDIIDDFKRCAGSSEIAALQEDIDRFLSIDDLTLDRPFRDTFKPDVNPCAFHPTSRRFLEAIRDLLN